VDYRRGLKLGLEGENVKGDSNSITGKRIIEFANRNQHVQYYVNREKGVRWGKSFIERNL